MTARTAFVSEIFLSKQYKSIPADVLNNSIFIFKGKRSWLFPSTRADLLEAKNLAPAYLEFDQEYKSLIQQKEEARLVFWFSPNKNYQEMSSFLEGITDLSSGEPYSPLRLDEEWWYSEFKPEAAKFISADGVVRNLKTGDFDYDAVRELLYQSNPSLTPILYWSEG